jgi:hypothetical protein
MKPEYFLDVFLHCHLQDDRDFVVLLCVVTQIKISVTARHTLMKLMMTMYDYTHVEYFL